jgi:hypothetical protein
MTSNGRTSLCRLLLAGMIAALAASLAFAASSSAGVYHVFSCRIPYGPLAGEAAPVQTASGAGEEAGRWSLSVTGNAQTSDRCAEENALIAALQAGNAHTEADLATWEFDAPANESISAATLWRAGNSTGGDGYLFWLSTPTDSPANSAFTNESAFDGCAYSGGCIAGVGNPDEPLSLANKVEVPAPNLGGSHLYINASCSSASCPSSSGDEQGHAVVVYVYATDIALEEQTAPSVSNLGGELAGGEPLSGTASLFFQASDPGSGIYRQIVSVDGKVLESQVVEETGLCKEVPVPAEDGPAFLSAQPCPVSANGRVSLDTTKLSNGTHQLLVEVTDAAGNATTVISKTIDVANDISSPESLPTESTIDQIGQTGQAAPPSSGQIAGPQSNGAPASTHPTLAAAWLPARGARLEGASKLRLTGDFDERETVAGRLTAPGGTAITDARIEVSARESYGGAPRIALGYATTDSQGRFTFRLAKQSPSEQLELSYSPTLAGSPVVSQALQLTVRAGVELQVSPGSVSAGGSIRLRGRILGAPIPPGGKQIVLEAHSKGSPWLQFLVVRTGSGGHFEGTHRFRLPGPVRYWFRALCPQEADYPFATGSSDQVTVWER